MMLSGAMDKSAIALSGVCIAHCLALPAVVALLPALSAYWFAGESFHLLLLFMVLPTSIVALGLGCRHHRTYGILLWGTSGLLVLTAAAGLGQAWVGEAAEKVLTVIGATLVMVAHANNFRLCRHQDCDH